MKKKDEKIGFQFKILKYIENINMNVFKTSDEIECVFILIKIQFE